MTENVKKNVTILKLFKNYFSYQKNIYSIFYIDFTLYKQIKLKNRNLKLSI